jgi:phage terminase large subunit-like protein
MHIAKLRELATLCVTNPNYHFRDLTLEQTDEMAQKSYQRLPPAQQTKVAASWKTALEEIGEELTSESLKELLRLRFLAQTNLFFLCNLLEKYNQVTINTHEDICNKFFVQKDPTFATFEKFANQYTDLKERMLLVPRGGFKSSIDIADCVQWIICYPAVTILILTGVYKLAGDFVGELKQHFTLEETGEPDAKGKVAYAPAKLLDAETGEWSPSLFQIIFPEHCVTPLVGTQHEFQTPAGGSDKEPSVRAASIEQALSGSHFGVLKLDDVVTNENSTTVERINTVNKQININQAMLHPYGFFDVIGTWYDEKDYYGVRIKQEETFAKEDGMLSSIHGSVDSGRFNSGVMLKVYLRAAWWLNEAAEKAGKIEAEAKKEDYDLWFPERLTYEFLSNKRKTDPDSFPIKYLNNPRQLHKVKFPRELLMRRTIPGTQLPPQGIVVSTVDTAYSTKSWADYTVILTCLIAGGRFFIINMVRGRFNEYELPGVIAATAAKWKPKRIAIEDSMGVKWMGQELKREMNRLQISVPVEYCSLGYGTKAKAKAMKAKPVLRLLGDERMYFLNSCEGLQELYNELEKFTGTSDDTHDDIVSALSLMAEQFGAYADMGAKTMGAEQDFVSDQKAKDMHDKVYGLGKYAKYNASQIQGDENPTTQYQLESETRKFRLDEFDAANADPFTDAGLF